jgi:hypothetical protein
MTTRTFERTINIAPTDEGWAQTAITFYQSVLSDVKKNRKDDSQELLKSTVEVVFWLGAECGEAMAAHDIARAQKLKNLRDQIQRGIF